MRKTLLTNIHSPCPRVRRASPGYRPSSYALAMEHLATQLRSQTSAPSDGSRTITLRDTQSRALDTDESSSLSRSGSVPGQNEGSDAGAVGTLRLRGVARRSTQRVAWGEDVVDNEGCGKKKSKSMSPFPSLPFFLFCVFSLLYGTGNCY